MNDAEEILKNIVNKEYNKELEDKPTFTEDMVKHIKDVYKDLYKKRAEWLANKEKEES